MSDQSLRAALEKLADELRWKGDMRPWQEGGGPDAYDGGLDDAAAKIRAVLAAHPVEPAPVVTDEAVQDLHAGVVTQFRRHGQYALADARAALETAAPLLGPRPLLDQQALAKAINDVAVSTGLAKYFKSGTAADPSDVEEFVFAVTEVARPMPTREQIAEVITARTLVEDELFGLTPGTVEHSRALAAAVLALLNGAES
jgi:hypothetical protein